MSKARTGIESRRATGALLTLNAVLIAAVMFQWTPPSPATAGPSQAHRPQGVVNPADQRNDMIKELRRVNLKLDALNEKLSRPFEVKVIQMPAGQED